VFLILFYLFIHLKVFFNYFISSWFLRQVGRSRWSFWTLTEPNWATWRWSSCRRSSSSLTHKASSSSFRSRVKYPNDDGQIYFYSVLRRFQTSVSSVTFPLPVGINQSLWTLSRTIGPQHWKLIYTDIYTNIYIYIYKFTNIYKKERYVFIYVYINF